jgi:hypothetical protein
MERAPRSSNGSDIMRRLSGGIVIWFKIGRGGGLVDEQGRWRGHVDLIDHCRSFSRLKAHEMTRADPELDEPRISGVKVDARGGFLTADDIARAGRRICPHVASCYQGGGIARPVLRNAVSASLRLFPLGRPEMPEARLIRRTVPPMGKTCVPAATGRASPPLPLTAGGRRLRLRAATGR